MYRYYITRKTPEGVMEYPTTTAPNVIESYGQNGSQFEGFTERFWGYVEFEQELPGRPTAWSPARPPSTTPSTRTWPAGPRR